jgi:hypothetical protein
MPPTSKSPSNRSAGGRPPNAWNSSRNRKLIRLYFYTTLKKKEIREVLRDEGFYPRQVLNRTGQTSPLIYLNIAQAIYKRNFNDC